MSDRDRWELHGLVRTLDVRRTWLENGDHGILEFRPDGAMTRHWHRNPDGSEFTTLFTYDNAGRLISAQDGSASIPHHLRRYEYDAEGRLTRLVMRDMAGNDRLGETYSYDAQGRKTKTHFVDLAGQRANTHYLWGVEGSKASYSAPGATRITTTYDLADRPTELLFHDAAGTLLRRVDFLYDESGNLAEEVQTLAVSPFPGLEELPVEQAQALRALLSGPYTRRIHKYDALGNRIETIGALLGSVGKDRETLTYNAHGDLIEQISKEESREYGFSEEGQLDSKPGPESRSETRFLYEYDTRGNWISKITEVRYGDNLDYLVSSTETRALTYFDPI